MQKDKLLKKINGSPAILALALALIFLLMLYCNLKTPLVADDYRYCFSFADDTRIESLAQIFPSMAAHRRSMNGRLVAHFLVQLFLMLPLPIFKLTNAAAFTLLIYLIYDASRCGRAHNALMLCSLFGAVWVLQPQFGQVFLWLDGSVNYLWCAVLCLLWLRPLVSDFLSGHKMSAARHAAYCVFSLCVGAYSENSTVALVFMALLFMLLRRFYRRERTAFSPLSWQLHSLVCMLIGFALMMLTPGELGNKSAELALPVLLSNFVQTLISYLHFWPLLLLWAFMYSLLLRRGSEQALRLLSLVFVGGSLAGHFVLTFALYCAGRSTYIALVLLLCACGLLFPSVFSGREKKLLCAVCALCLCLTLYWGYRGVKDILATDYKLRFNEALIAAAAENGERDVQLPRPYASTRYSALDGLPYLETDRTDDWSNIYMAKYYGVESVIGY